MKPEFEPRQPGRRVSSNHHREVVIEPKGSVKGGGKIK